MEVNSKPIRLVYGMIGTNCLEQLQNLKTVEPMIDQVDLFVYVDGSKKGEDGVAEWLRETYTPEKVQIIHKPWCDDFTGHRTLYLDAAKGSVDYDTWVIVSDTDEKFSPLLAKGIRPIIDQARKQGHDMLQVRCESRTVTMDSWEEITWSNLDDFWKPLVFRYKEGMSYWADRSDATGKRNSLHEALGVNRRFVWRPVPLNDQDGKLVYYHIKRENVIWIRGLRNFVISGGGPNLNEKQPLWLPFRSLISEALGRDDYTYLDVLDYFKKGSIDQRIKDMMLKHRNEEGYDGSSEVQEVFKTYFLLYNPEELPEDLRQEYAHMIPQHSYEGII